MIEANSGVPHGELVPIVQYLVTSRFDAAIQESRGVQARYPQSIIGFVLEGVAWFSKGKIGPGREAIEKALDIRPGDPGACHVLAHVAVKQGRIDEARGYYRDALENNPDDLATLMRFYQLELSAGDRGAAKAILERALNSHPHAVNPRIELVRMLLDDGDTEAGLRVAQEGLEITPESDALLVAVGKAHMDGQQPAEAMAIFQQVAVRLPGSIEGNFLLAQAAIAARAIPILPRAPSTSSYRKNQTTRPPWCCEPKWP